MDRPGTARTSRDGLLLLLAVVHLGAVLVPLFVSEGDMLKVDTREGGSYVSRVK